MLARDSIRPPKWSPKRNQSKVVSDTGVVGKVGLRWSCQTLRGRHFQRGDGPQRLGPAEPPPGCPGFGSMASARRLRIRYWVGQVWEPKGCEGWVSLQKAPKPVAPKENPFLRVPYFGNAQSVHFEGVDEKSAKRKLDLTSHWRSCFIPSRSTSMCQHVWCLYAWPAH